MPFRERPTSDTLQEKHLGKKVKGVLFADYVRMLKSRKGVDWSRYLKPEDMIFLDQKILESEWK
jgi:hypothetical protein